MEAVLPAGGETRRCVEEGVFVLLTMTERCSLWSALSAAACCFYRGSLMQVQVRESQVSANEREIMCVLLCVVRLCVCVVCLCVCVCVCVCVVCVCVCARARGVAFCVSVQLLV